MAKHRILEPHSGLARSKARTPLVPLICFKYRERKLIPFLSLDISRNHRYVGFGSSAKRTRPLPRWIEAVAPVNAREQAARIARDRTLYAHIEAKAGMGGIPVQLLTPRRTGMRVSVCVSDRQLKVEFESTESDQARNDLFAIFRCCPDRTFLLVQTGGCRPDTPMEAPFWQG